MRASRLLSILIHLQARGRATARELADEFEVTLRTIYRDIDELSASGVPVVAERGPGGGYRLIDGYQTRLTGLTASEAETLLLAGLPGPAADLGLGDALGAARAKLLASLSPEVSENASRIGGRFHLDASDWFRKASPPACLGQVAQAVWQQRCIAIHYESWSSTGERVLDPLGLVLKAGAWYLVARNSDSSALPIFEAGKSSRAKAGAAARSHARYSRQRKVVSGHAGEVRTFKIARIQQLQTLDEAFDYPRDFNLAQHWAVSLQQFQGALKHDRATLRIAERAMDWIDHLGVDVAAAARETMPSQDGWRVCEVPIEKPDMAAWQLLGFGDSIKVLAPQALRDKIIDIAGRILALYKFETAHIPDGRDDRSVAAS